MEKNTKLVPLCLYVAVQIQIQALLQIHRAAIGDGGKHVHKAQHAQHAHSQSVS